MTGPADRLSETWTTGLERGSSQLTQLELGWLVGLLEGEGTFRYTKTCHVGIAMVDEDIITRYINTIEKIIGHRCELRSYKPPRDNTQEIYRAYIYGKNAELIMRTIVPFMSYRRRRMIWRALNKYTPKQIQVNMKEITQNIIALRRVS